jgi:hypothetical protein
MSFHGNLDLVYTKVTVQKIFLTLLCPQLSHDQNYISDSYQKNKFNKQHNRVDERHIRVINVLFTGSNYLKMSMNELPDVRIY